jgi:hypothetical protein
MRKLVALAVLALGVALFPTGAGAGTAGTGAVTIVHAATYDAGQSLTVTLCVDDEVVDGSFETEEILGPLDLEPGTYNVEIFIGTDQPCAGEPDIQADLEVAAGDDVTAAAVWTSLGPDSGHGGPSIVVWPNDSGCLDADQARVTVRHGAYTDGPVDVVATVGGTETTLVEGLDEEEQATLEVPAGTVAEDVEIQAGIVVLASLGDLGPFEGGTQYVVYAIGGADGSIGAFVDVIDEQICGADTTTTTVAPTTTAAAAATATPRFTG